MLTTALSSARECGLPMSNIYVFDTFDKTPYNDMQSWEELLEYGESDWAVFQNTEKSKNTVATLSFTSGTTGLPKAAMIPHSYTVSQSSALLSRNKPYEVSKTELLRPLMLLIFLLGHPPSLPTCISSIWGATPLRQSSARGSYDLCDAEIRHPNIPHIHSTFWGYRDRCGTADDIRATHISIGYERSTTIIAIHLVRRRSASSHYSKSNARIVVARSEACAGMGYHRDRMGKHACLAGGRRYWERGEAPRRYVYEVGSFEPLIYTT